MTWLVFLNYLFRIVCVVGAVVLLLKGINHGWGWLIFAAIASGIRADRRPLPIGRPANSDVLGLRGLGR